MLHYLFQCRSLTYAQRTAAALERVGITSYLLRTPKRIAGEGCSYCVKISARNASNALSVLRQIGLAPIRIFKSDGSGRYQEVTL